MSQPLNVSSIPQEKSIEILSKPWEKFIRQEPINLSKILTGSHEGVVLRKPQENAQKSR